MPIRWVWTAWWLRERERAVTAMKVREIRFFISLIINL
jgi:hypothetical protein